MRFIAVIAPDGKVVLYDMYVSVVLGWKWIGSRRTVKQCLEAASYIMNDIYLFEIHDDVS